MMRMINQLPVIKRVAPHLRYQIRTIFWGPLIAGMSILFLFAGIPQSREVYLGIIEANELRNALVGLIFVGFLCALLNYWQYKLTTNMIDRSYLEHGDRAIDRVMMTMRRYLVIVCACLPLIGLGLGLGFLVLEAREARSKFGSAMAHLAGDNWGATFPEFGTATTVLSLVPVYLVAGVIFAGIVAYLIFTYALPSDFLVKWRARVRPAIFYAGAALTVAAMVMPLTCQDCVVAASQALGPLAVGTIVLIAGVFCVMFVSIASSVNRWPIMGIVTSFLVVYMALQIWRALTPSDKTALPSPTAQVYSDQVLLDQYKAWFAARKKADVPAFDIAKGRSGRYPVFIVAAQGGGIYAMSAAASFLAAMQDTCPGFAQHVFAISGVSGGAVGAALFSALNAQQPLTSEIGCGNESNAREETSLSEKTKRVVRQDHLSPALAMIWPDIVRKYREDVSFDRSSLLERSLACAFEPPTNWRTCGGAGANVLDVKGLRVPFSAHWKPDLRSPALVLNTTWVETGFRAAFAPFPLHSISDGTLYTFYGSDAKYPGKGDFEVVGASVPNNRSLIEAAFVSARFPLIVPAWPINATLSERPPLTRHWNFVDGGYVDNSGASTALELYAALKEHIGKTGDPVDLYLVLLTAADISPNLRDIKDGTSFSDTVAPATALLSVRGQLSSRAVIRAIDQIEPNPRPGQLAGRAGATKVLVVNQKQSTFELPLGWKISQTTDDIVRLMLGRSDLCNAQPHGPLDESIRDAVSVIRDNSCVKLRLMNLLQGKTF